VVKDSIIHFPLFLLSGWWNRTGTPQTYENIYISNKKTAIGESLIFGFEIPENVIR